MLRSYSPGTACDRPRMFSSNPGREQNVAGEVVEQSKNNLVDIPVYFRDQNRFSMSANVSSDHPVDRGSRESRTVFARVSLLSVLL